MIVPIKPTAASERIAYIDMLRGFAVFGILLSNILIFSGFLSTPFTDLGAYTSAGINHVLFYLSNAFVLGKFYTIFCMLFGYGFYMQAAKYNKSDKSFVTYYARRLLILLFIGLLHQFIWPGDILTRYALVGFLFLFVIKTTYKQDLYLALTFFSIFLVLGFYPQLFPAPELAPKTKPLSYMSFPGVDPLELIQRLRTEGLSGMYYFYIPFYKSYWSLSRLAVNTNILIGLFFLGGYLYKTDFLNKGIFKTRNLIIYFVIGLIGLYLRYYVAYPFRIFDSLFLALFYMGILRLIYKKKAGRKFLHFFVPLGRMALTCYILQTILCIYTFYGLGFGLFAQLPLYQVYFVALAMLVIQVVFCKLWLSIYHFGPIEWVWRSLSYGKRIPLKIEEEQIRHQQVKTN